MRSSILQRRVRWNLVLQTEALGLALLLGSPIQVNISSVARSTYDKYATHLLVNVTLFPITIPGITPKRDYPLNISLLVVVSKFTHHQ